MVFYRPFAYVISLSGLLDGCVRGRGPSEDTTPMFSRREIALLNSNITIKTRHGIEKVTPSRKQFIQR
jgi:hypothetical protein